MSSIISDIFYGSKQNILDNYLINRHDANQPSSLHQRQQTVSYASFIQLIIQLPKITQLSQSLIVRVEAEMGNRNDEAEIEIKPKKIDNKGNVEIILTLQDVQKQDLNKFTNIKLSISEEGCEKLVGFIPIEIVKGIANSFSNEKTIAVQMRGKSTLPFTSIQCTIRTEFPNNNILNSQILRSMEKDHESYIKNKNHISGEKSQNPSNIIQSRSRQASKRRQNSNSNNRPSVRNTKNIVIEDETSRDAKKSKLPHALVVEYTKEIRSIKILFTKIELNQSFKEVSGEINLKINQRQFKLNEIIQLNDLTKKGVNIQVILNDRIIGTIHLSPLLLTQSKIYGELPIYSPLQQCLGTIVIQSPNNNKAFQHKPRPSVNGTRQKYQKQADQADSHMELMLLSIDKITLLHSEGVESSTLEPDNLNFEKMEAQNKIQVLLRVKQVTHKFSDVVLHYNIDRQSMKIVELRRKQGFKLHYFQPYTQQLTVEVQIFSANRLVTYCKTNFSEEDVCVHKFLSGDSQSVAIHCGIYLKLIRLQPNFNYFQEHKIGTIFSILQEIIDNKIIFNELDDVQIKKVMNIHRNVTYIELKKLTMLLQRNFKQLKRYQRSSLCTIYRKQTPQVNGKMITLAQRLLQQFLYICNSKSKMVSLQQFQKIISFYKQDLQLSLDEVWRQFVSNPVIDNGNILFIFFIAGFYFLDRKQTEIENSLEINQEELSTQKQKETQTLYSNKIPQIPNPVKVQPSYFICKINITNAHLLNMGKAPNICLNLARNVSYSNSNPQFIIQKEIGLLQTIKIFHKSIAQDRLVLLAEFQPLRRQTYYELQPSGKCLAKITWGL